MNERINCFLYRIRYALVFHHQSIKNVCENLLNNDPVLRLASALAHVLRPAGYTHGQPNSFSFEKTLQIQHSYTHIII